MDALLIMARAEMRESLRARWFFIYVLVFGGAVVLLFLLRVTESQVMGFTGLGRLLLTYIQLVVAVLPIFILVTTVRAVVGNRESNVLEYLLSFPISLGGYYWGLLLGRFVIVFLPATAAMLAAVAWGLLKGLDVPWAFLGYYALLLGALAWSFLGAAILISSAVRRVEWGLGLAFLTWLACLLLVDIVLIGVLIRLQASETLVIGLALLNPLQSFRMAAMLLFDPELTVIGPTAYVIQDLFGRTGFLVFALVYPVVLGWLLALLGHWVFRSRDLI
ncbi:MAG: ABC transporter permease subunit [Candidatus Lambdaproteobacteria bacterium]|nr:ABC transporter permease subunit [Candidatus Lambdaproteobacteria bacterium]